MRPHRENPRSSVVAEGSRCRALFSFFARSLYPYANLEICNKDSLKSRVRDLKAMLKHGTLRSRVPEKLLNAAVVNADPETTIDW